MTAPAVHASPEVEDDPAGAADAFEDPHASGVRPTLVVAGVSVRALAESARRAGLRVIALDLFGDLDTRRASERWTSIGDPAALAIDPPRLRAALAEAARTPGVIGWVAGAGFEGAPALLDAGGAGLPLLGMPAATVAAVRDARHFFATLDRLGLQHPPTLFRAPTEPRDWLAKDPGGCGGWHIRPAGESAPARAYYQRFQPGVPMSALFVADGRAARLVALNRLLVQPWGSHPHVYGGVIGPIVDDALQARIDAALDALVPAFQLRGLASLDFIAADGLPWLLEINPRPSASMLLHEDAWAGGLLLAHLQAVGRRLPTKPPRHPRGVRGQRIVFAPARCDVDDAMAQALGRCAHCHDLPAAATHFEPGEPVCSVSAEAADAEAVERLLAVRNDRIHTFLTREEPLSWNSLF